MPSCLLHAPFHGNNLHRSPSLSLPLCVPHFFTHNPLRLQDDNNPPPHTHTYISHIHTTGTTSRGSPSRPSCSSSCPTPPSSPSAPPSPSCSSPSCPPPSRVPCGRLLWCTLKHCWCSSTATCAWCGACALRAAPPPSFPTLWKAQVRLLHSRQLRSPRVGWEHRQHSRCWEARISMKVKAQESALLPVAVAVVGAGVGAQWVFAPGGLHRLGSSVR